MRSRLKVKVEKRAASRRGHEGREQNQATNCNLTTHEFKQASHDQEEGHDARQHHDGGLEDRDLVGAAAGHRRGKWRRREGEVLFSLRSMTLGQRRKKKECPRVSRGKERRTKQKQKQASKQEKKRPSLSPSPCSLLKKKSRRSKQKKNAAQRLSIHPLRISPRAFQQKCASPSCSSLSAWRFSRPWYGRWKRLWASVVPVPASSSLSSPSKKKHSRLHPAP